MRLLLIACAILFAPLASAAAKLPTFALAGLENPGLASASLAGKPAVFQFWASWCPSCEGVSRELREALRSTPQLPLVAVSLDETFDAALSGAKKRRADGAERQAFYFDKGRALADQIGAVAVPTVLVVDANQNIVLRLEGHMGAAQIGALRQTLKRVSP